MSSKRARSTSPSPSISSSPPTSPTTSKLIKTTEDAPHGLLTCNLPPTCAHKPTRLASTRELETHYATYHSHVCEHQNCGRVFPGARLLELHFAECHDPIIALRKERGEKTFACHLSSCNRFFLTPKARRLHLIQAHGYPKEYFFAVTNKGIGGLLSKWGQGASLIRGEWKPRIRDQEMESTSDSDAEDTRVHLAREEPSMDDADSPPEDDRTLLSARSSSDPPSQSDALADAMCCLKLVPSKIRFGRGGKKGGFVHPAADRGTGSSSGVPTEKTKPTDHGPRPVRRRGGRRGSRRKASEGTSSTSGDPDVAAMQV